MDEQREELRLALVMNGGVSLAVWMGGVTNEIFRLVTQQHPVYRALLDMTRTTARVDVISGTSAGGVNGAALSIALLYGGDFSKLRDVWLSTGAFSDLLRPALGENPGSLLMGEEFFLPHILSAFDDLAAQAPAPIFTPHEMPIDLRLTTTLLSGIQGHSVDDLGSHVHDVDYRGQFRFRHTRDNDDDFKPREALVRELARAARSTASFPFAFEPSPVGPDNGHLVDVNGEPLETPRFVVDGGILDNKPFHGALSSIFSMHADRSVRRVLAYINPDPGDGPPGTPGKEAPPLSSVLAASLLGIPQSQTISDQLQEIREHNDSVRNRRDSVATTLTSLAEEQLDGLPGALFQVYRRRRIVDVFEGFVVDELPAASRRRSKDPTGQFIIGRRGRDQLQAKFLSIPWTGWIPSDWPAHPDDPAYARHTWQWGLYPVEFAAKVMLDLLRRTQMLSDFVVPHAAGAPATAPSPVAPMPAAPSDWSDPASDDEAAAPASAGMWTRLVSRAKAWTPGAALIADPPVHAWNRERVRQAMKTSVPAQLEELVKAWRDAYKCIDSAAALRKCEQVIWNDNADDLLALLDGTAPRQTDGVDAVLPEDFKRMFAFLVQRKRVETCGQLAHDIAGVILRVSTFVRDWAPKVRDDDSLRDSDRKAAKALLHIVDRLRAPAGSFPEKDLLFRLMQLEVVEFSFSDHDELANDSLIELVQISGNATSPIGELHEAKSKLLGLQLAHFGAFYKQSWRANDWTFGRLDGTERLVKILLNPDRLQRFYGNTASGWQDAVREITRIARDSIPSTVLRQEIEDLWSQREYEKRVARELEFLGRHDVAVPDSLPVCAEVVTMRLHFGILREELPALLEAIAADRSEGADALGPSDALLHSLNAAEDGKGTPTRPFSPEEARHALERGLIAGETLLDEAGSDLFTRTLAHTAATLQGLLASKAAKLGPVSIVFASLKVPILGFYFVARGLTRQSRTSAALHGGILAVGIAIVALSFFLAPTEAAKLGLAKPNLMLAKSIVTFGWALLAYGFLLSTARTPRTFALGAIVALPVVWVVQQGWMPLQAWLVHIGMPAVQALQEHWLLAVVAAIALLAGSLRFRVLRFVQWLVGFAAIAIAAQRSSGLEPGQALDGQGEAIFALAALICGTLLLAMWQTSHLSRAVEGRVRSLMLRFTQWRRRRSERKQAASLERQALDDRQRRAERERTRVR